MQLDDARNLKKTILSAFVSAVAAPSMAKTLAIKSQAVTHESQALRSIAIGIARAKKHHELAVRVQRRSLLEHPLVERIRKQAKGEVDVRYIGKLSKLETPNKLQSRRRPLVIGCSVGHYKITAGTLGCFVKVRGTRATLFLSNNHVLANENNAKVGDAIVQPGILDGGSNPADIVATLLKFIRLKVAATNFVDCAIARPAKGVSLTEKRLGKLGNLKGLGPAVLDEGTKVRKVGRTTGETKGRVTAFELDNVVIEYDLGNLRFDNQVEIEGAGTHSFSDGGDSGSLIVDEDNLGVALLFAGGDSGGANGMGLTYANPLIPVLDALKVDLVF